MDQTIKMAVEPAHVPGGAYVLCRGVGDLRTLRRYFWNLVLPALTLTAMSALTTVVLVVLVSAAADLNLSLYSHGQPTSPDPWSVACFGPACLWDGQPYSEPPATVDTLDRDQASPGESWSGSQAGDQADGPWARW